MDPKKAAHLNVVTFCISVIKLSGEVNHSNTTCLNFRKTLTTASLSPSEKLIEGYELDLVFFKVSLGTDAGRKLFMYVVLVPLVPTAILLAMSMSMMMTNRSAVDALTAVDDQINLAVDLATLARKLQKERVSVALNFFIRNQEDLGSVFDLNNYTDLDVNSKFANSFKMENTFQETDVALQEVKHWPKIQSTHFKDKLSFTIQHNIFRNKLKEGELVMEEVLEWYDRVNGEVLDYVVISIQDSDIRDFYRWIIGYKNLLNAVEYAGKAGILALQYLTREDGINEEKYEKFLQYDILRNEYLNQVVFKLIYVLYIKVFTTTK